MPDLACEASIHGLPPANRSVGREKSQLVAPSGNRPGSSTQRLLSLKRGGSSGKPRPSIRGGGRMDPRACTLGTDFSFPSFSFFREGGRACARRYSELRARPPRRHLKSSEIRPPARVCSSLLDRLAAGEG